MVMLSVFLNPKNFSISWFFLGPLDVSYLRFKAVQHTYGSWYFFSSVRFFALFVKMLRTLARAADSPGPMCGDGGVTQ